MERVDLTRRLAGKIAVVTAAGAGSGRATAERLAAEGAEVHASDLNGAGLEGLDVASTQTLDATDQAAVEAYFSQFERVDALVHAVGHVHHGTIEETSAADWRKSMDITLDSAFNVLQATIPRMKAHGGSIVTIGSIASSTKGFPNRVAYGAAKGGVIGLTKAVAADNLRMGIRANSVGPGTTLSPSLEGRIAEAAKTMGGYDAALRYFEDRQPMGRLGTPEEMASICAWLVSDESRFMTGQCVNIDGGTTG